MRLASEEVGECQLQFNVSHCYLVLDNKCARIIPEYAQLYLQLVTILIGCKSSNEIQIGLTCTAPQTLSTNLTSVHCRHFEWTLTIHAQGQNLFQIKFRNGVNSKLFCC